MHPESGYVYDTKYNESKNGSQNKAEKPELLKKNIYNLESCKKKKEKENKDT